MRLIACAGLLLFAAGCSGIHASHSVSPVDFMVPGGGGLLRGLLYVPPPALPDATTALALATEAPKQVASVR